MNPGNRKSSERQVMRESAMEMRDIRWKGSQFNRNQIQIFGKEQFLGGKGARETACKQDKSQCMEEVQNEVGK